MYMIKKDFIKNIDFNIKNLGVSEKDAVKAFQKAFLDTLVKKYDQMCKPEDFSVIVDVANGIIQLFHNLLIVENKNYDKTSFNTISLSEAKKKDKSFSVGDIYSEEISFSSFARRDVKYLQSCLENNLRFIKDKSFYDFYQSRIGEMISVKMYKFCQGYDIVKDATEKDLFFPQSEQNVNEKFQKNDVFKVIIKKIENRNGKVTVVVSRKDDIFLQKLISENVSEINDGIVLIKKIVRLPSYRKIKVVVDSVEENINPIGACIGINKSRLTNINKELRGDYIDFIHYNADKSIFMANVLGIKKVMKFKNGKDGVFVYVNEEDLETVFLNKCVNVNLLKLLLEEDVFVFKYIDKEDDSIDSLCDIIDTWEVAELKAKGLRALEDVFKYTKDRLQEMCDLEAQTVEKIYSYAEKTCGQKDTSKSTKEKK